MEQQYPEFGGRPVGQFMSELRAQTLAQHNVAYSENGAEMFGTTGKALLDLNFCVANLRDADAEEIIERFTAAADDDYTLALKWLFYARDVREGLGERRLGCTILRYLAVNRTWSIRHLIPYIPVYGRWDDLLCLFDSPLENDVLATIALQWNTDSVAMKYNKPISLMAKWLPSINTTSPESRRQATKIAKYMNMSVPAYRKMLVRFRKYLDIVEVKMTDNRWDEIDYAKVPSRANLIYSKAFMRHDPVRREAFLNAVLNGKAEMHSAMVFPHEIVNRYTAGGLATDELMNLMALWKNLPRFLDGGDTLVVSDGSGSMKSKPSSNSSVRCLDVAIALAIYFAEQLKGPYKDRVVTFSAHPQFVDLSNCKTLFDKIERMLLYTEVANTNIEAVFDMVLETALINHLEQKDLPKNILILSDMEFDRCVVGDTDHYADSNLFKAIAARYSENGYSIPRCCFWNIRGASGAIPMIKNDMGVALMSGFSINNTKLIMSGKLDPYEALIEILNSERYSPIYPERP